MQIRTGTPIMKQIVAGRLHMYRRETPAVVRTSQRDPEQEVARFYRAQRQGVQELLAMHARATEQVGEETAAIFAVHAMLMEDEELVDSVLRLVKETGATAEYAVMETGNTFADAFDRMDDLYMKARAADIRDVEHRFLRHLVEGWRPFRPEEPAILVADSFLPSEVMSFDRNLLGLISRKGTVDSHTAQLLRAYHIPAVVGVELEACWQGHLALIDGHRGNIYLDPEPTVFNELRERYQNGGRPE